MIKSLDSFGSRLFIPAILLFVYFVSFPDDLGAVLAPIELILELTDAVSPWLYGLGGFGFVAWTIVRIWGTTNKTTRKATPRR